MGLCSLNTFADDPEWAERVGGAASRDTAGAG